MAERKTRPGRSFRFALGLMCATAAGIAVASDLPPVTDADRAAAFPELPGPEAGGHAHSDPLTGMFKAEQLEWQDRSDGEALKWDAVGWLGYDMHRLWLRDEGEHVDGESVENRLELLYGRPLTAWWDVLVGWRHDSGETPTRNYLAIGFQGLAPQWLHVQATGYAGDRGHLGVRVEADYDWLITNRLVLTARVEAEVWNEDHERELYGSGPTETGAGLRLRYELWREFAPYVGVEWKRLYGDTATDATAAGKKDEDTSFVAGLRFWF